MPGVGVQSDLTGSREYVTRLPSSGSSCAKRGSVLASGVIGSWFGGPLHPTALFLHTAIARPAIRGGGGYARA